MLIGSRAFAADDAVILQVRADFEAGAQVTDRPVASGLTHELVHVSGGIFDNENEQKLTAFNPEPVDLPAVTQPSIMNSFPFYRSLQHGGANSIAFSPITDTESLCATILGGYSNLDFTE